jgi:hypothetical protein
VVSQPASAVPVKKHVPPPGEQSPQGEVSAADLSFAIGGTGANSNTVQPLDETADQAAIIAKIHESIQALRR